jgi:aryl-alcohol dehydrogenase-like predicted oxidoreductase
MKYRRVGASGLAVSEICLGTMLFGSYADEKTSLNIIAQAREQGVNFIDSADVYVRGQAEEIVGRAIAKERDKWVIGTKLGAGMSDAPAPNQRGLSRKWIFQEVEASLKRLGTDYIDIYYPHREDPNTPLTETLGALTDLVRQGKIRYYGISNHQSWKLAEYSRLADQLGAPRPIASQLCYNAFDRRPEKDHFHITEYYGLGNVVYSALARGVLTGKYDPEAEPPADSRAGRKDRKMFQTEWRPESLNAAQKLRAYAEAKGIAAGEFAFAWVLRNASVASVIAGPKTEAQWEGYVRALSVELTAEDEVFVDSLVKPGYASTHGYSDPADTAPLRKLVAAAR